MKKKINASDNQIKTMLSKINMAIGECEASEKDIYEALMDIASGWGMRLEELNEQEENR